MLKVDATTIANGFRMRQYKLLSNLRVSFSFQMAGEHLCAFSCNKAFN